MKRRSVPPEEEAQRRELYAGGLNDYQIAAAVGGAPVTIAGWRRRRGLPPNTPAGVNSRGDPSIAEMTEELRLTSKKLLEKGVSARIISRTFGLSLKTLDRYRGIILREHPELRRPTVPLPPPPVYPNGRKYSRMRIERRRRAFKLYAEGASDISIAATLEIDRQSIVEWRHAFHLAPNFRRGQTESKRVSKAKRRRALAPAISPRSNPLYARVAEAIGRGLAPDIADDAISDLMLAVLEGRITEDQLVSGARSVRRKVVQSYANRWSPSLDEDLGDGDGFRMIDRLRDDRSSSWLEEMGATVW